MRSRLHCGISLIWSKLTINSLTVPRWQIVFQRKSGDEWTDIGIRGWIFDQHSVVVVKACRSPRVVDHFGPAVVWHDRGHETRHGIVQENGRYTPYRLLKVMAAGEEGVED